MLRLITTSLLNRLPIAKFLFMAAFVGCILYCACSPQVMEGDKVLEFRSELIEIGAVSYGDEIVVSCLADKAIDATNILLITSWGTRHPMAFTVGERAGWIKVEGRFLVESDVLNTGVGLLLNADSLSLTYRDFAANVQPHNARRKTDTEAIDLKIDFAPEHLSAIKKMREAAILGQVTLPEHKHWVDVVIVTHGAESQAKLRLKGDWTDHLAGEKWSYRIKEYSAGKVQEEYSIQSPVTRGMLKEWVFHRWLELEGLLATSYQFVVVQENEEVKGLYAKESHFTRSTLSRQGRGAGPILAWDEAELWQDRKIGKKTTSPEYFLRAKVKSYVSTDSNAINLMVMLQNNPTDVLPFINQERLAKFLAIVDIAGADHALRWHNQRWYYDPTTKQLEPVGYDGYPGERTDAWPLVATYKGTNVGNINRLLQEEELFGWYKLALLEFSSDNYQQKFQQNLDSALRVNETKLQKEYPKYVWNWQEWNERVRDVRNQMQELQPPK